MPPLNAGGTLASRRTYLEFIDKGLDGRCKVCRNHRYLVLDLGFYFCLHTYIASTLENLARDNIIHMWEITSSPPDCRKYYKEIA